MFGVSFFTRKYVDLKRKTVETTNETLEAFFKLLILVLSIFTIVWISVFLYVAFYYTYVPSIEHIKPVSFEFTACDSAKNGNAIAVCSFPKAHVLLTKSNSLLMVGQPYKISVTLEVPESDENRSVGMFLICGQLYGKGIVVAHACRSTMLRYRSPLLRALKMLALSGFYIFNVIEEKQTLEIELFSNFEEDRNYPVTNMHIELRTERVQVYSSNIRIDAHLTGLRYLMFHWPTISALLGVSFNVMVILFIVLLSWWQLYGPYSLTGREFSFHILKEKLSSTCKKSKSKNEKIESFGPYTGNGNVVHEIKNGKARIDDENEEEDSKSGFIKLKNDFEEEGEERKFILERKSSSSEA